MVGLETGPATLDPRYATDAASVTLCRLIYASAFRRGEAMQLRPSAALRLERPDPRTYLVHLRPGLFFHDGRPLTAEDLRYTIASITAASSPSPLKSGFGRIESMAIDGPLALRIRLKEPFAPFADALTVGIVPRGAGEELARVPVGAGPFRFVEYRQGERLLLMRNENYSGGPPRLPALLFRIVPDETVRLLELKKGALHLITSPITPAVLPWLGEQEGIRVAAASGTNVSYIGFNLRDKALADPLVRRAIAHAIDRDAIIAHLLKGLGEKTETFIAPANRYHAAGLPEHRHDPAEARRLLDLAGYPDRGDGRPRLTLTFKTSKNPTRRTIAEVFAEELGQVGIKLEIKSQEWGAFFADIKSGNFQLYSLTWVGITDPDILHFIFHSSSLPPAGANRGGYADAVLDRLLEKGRAVADEAERKKLYDEAQRRLAAQLPCIALWTGRNVAAMNARLKGFVIAPDENLDSLAAARWEEQ